jgi:hypothetical protein
MPRHYYWDTMCAKPGNNEAWTSLLKRKYTSKDPLTRSDFDTILKGYTSVADFPASLFAKELISAYPEAKVVLTVRDSPDAWYKSFSNTVWHFQRQKFFPETWMERFWYWNLSRQAHDSMYSLVMAHTPLARFPEEGRQWYVEHNQMVRELVPKDRLLEFNAKDGWEPLCRFLDREVPEMEYPRVNDTRTFQGIIEPRWERFRVLTVRKILRRVSVGMVVIAGVCAWVSYVRSV